MQTILGTTRDLERFFRNEGFSRSESLRLVSKLRKTEGFQARDERTTSLAERQHIKTVRIISDDSSRLYKEMYKLSRQVHFLTELCKNEWGYEADPRDEAEHKTPQIGDSNEKEDCNSV